MKGNCNYQPPATVPYGNTGGGQVNFMVARNDKMGDDGKMQENWDYQVAEVSDFKREKIIAAIIREKYSQHAVEAIINNHLAGTDKGEFAQLQAWRNMAKAVADGLRMETDLLPVLETEVPGRIDEIDDTLQAVTETLIEKGITP